MDDEAQVDPGELERVVRRFLSHPGLGGKSELRLVREVFGDTDWVTAPGDDAAAIPDAHGFTLAAGEAVWPPFVSADPAGAGAAAVVANVNDIAAMGGRPLGLVDQIVASRDVARRVLEGLRHAADLYDVPVVGGHLTIRDGPAFVAASVVGRATHLLSATGVAPAQRILIACALEGRMREDFDFFSSLRDRGSRLAEDIRVLPTLAEQGICRAAKDVSMAGLLGSVAMLLEPTRSGATIDLEALPRPEEVALDRWTGAFPTYGFVLTAAADEVVRCKRAFADRGLAVAEVGQVDASSCLRARLGVDEATLIDWSREAVTQLGPPANPPQP